MPWLCRRPSTSRPAALRDPHAGRVEQLQHGVVPRPRPRAAEGARSRSAWPRPSGGTTASAGVAAGSGPAAPGSARSRRAATRKRKQLLTLASFRPMLLLASPRWCRRREVRAHAPHVDRRRDRGRPRDGRKRRELAEVARVAAERVRRGPALHGQILEKRADRVVHHARLTQRPSGRSPARTRTLADARPRHLAAARVALGQERAPRTSGTARSPAERQRANLQLG